MPNSHINSEGFNSEEMLKYFAINHCPDYVSADVPTTE